MRKIISLVFFCMTLTAMDDGKKDIFCIHIEIDDAKLEWCEKSQQFKLVVDLNNVRNNDCQEYGLKTHRVSETLFRNAVKNNQLDLIENALRQGLWCDIWGRFRDAVKNTQDVSDDMLKLFLRYGVERSSCFSVYQNLPRIAHFDVLYKDYFDMCSNLDLCQDCIDSTYFLCSSCGCNRIDDYYEKMFKSMPVLAKKAFDVFVAVDTNNNKKKDAQIVMFALLWKAIYLRNTYSSYTRWSSSIGNKGNIKQVMDYCCTLICDARLQNEFEVVSSESYERHRVAPLLAEYERKHGIKKQLQDNQKCAQLENAIFLFV